MKLEIKHGKAIDAHYTWTPTDDPLAPCPKGVKVQLLGAGGIPQYGSWDGKNPFWTHYALLPSHRSRETQPEPVEPHATLLAEYQKQVAEGTTGFYLWEASALPDKWTDIGIPDWSSNLQYRCIDISCYVSKDGEPAIRMLRTEAQKSQAELGDTVEWKVKHGAFNAVAGNLSFAYTGTYTYRTKPAKVVKLVDVPVGVLFNHGKLLGFRDGMVVLFDGIENVPSFVVPEELLLAPAADQPWIAFQGKNIHEQINKLTMAGFVLEVDGNRYRVLSLAEGYKLEGSK